MPRGCAALRATCSAASTSISSLSFRNRAPRNGELFTPPSIVQTVVNVIRPEHGIVFDPARGSGGMFVQSSYFIEDEGLDTITDSRAPSQNVAFRKEQ